MPLQRAETPPLTPAAGLSSQEALARLREAGPNEMQDRESRGLGRIVLSVLAEPMFLLLLAAAAVYLAIGDLSEGALLACFAILTVVLVVVQERRSERALDALRALAAPRSRVIRDGVEQSIAARDLVPGDLLLLSEGERIAADALVRECTALAVDESVLTGESLPVRKQAWQQDHSMDDGPPGGEDRPWVYAATIAVSGHALAQVCSTGSRTQAGRIGASLAAIESEPTPLELSLKRLVRVFGAMAIVLSALVALWHGLHLGDWAQGLLSGIALGMAMLPEEFPMALAVLLSLGAWRLAKRQVLARRPAVIEALGAATVLCVDKTGTLTENRMRVCRLVAGSHAIDPASCLDAALPGSVQSLLTHAALACPAGSADPMDRAISATAARLAPAANTHDGWRLEREFGLSPGLLAVSHLWCIEGDHRMLAIKGAPEAVAMLCRLDAASTQRLMDEVGILAAQGLRVLAVAAAQGTMPLLRSPLDAHPTLLGLIAFEDPIRPSVPAAVAQAAEAGVTVAMITGDHASTALAIARRAGIDTSAGVLTGEAIEGMDDQSLRRAVQRGRIFARVLPHQKLRLVQAFKANGDVVAMTGDGVNDAPALKAAHIGVAMGVRGTDVAREASDIVLLDEDFGRIVDAVRMGRRICDNLRKVMTYITAIHVPIAGLALLPLVFGLPPLLLPVHVVLTEMVIDPICSIAFESAPEDPDIMRRAPRPASQPLIGIRLLALGLFQGLAVLAASFGTFAFLLASGEPADAARAVTIIALTAGNLTLVWINAVNGLPMRLWLDGGLRAFWIIAGLCALVMSAALVIAPWREMLHFSVPGMDTLLAAIGLQLAVAMALGWISQRLHLHWSDAKPCELAAA